MVWHSVGYSKPAPRLKLITTTPAAVAGGHGWHEKYGAYSSNTLHLQDAVGSASWTVTLNCVGREVMNPSDGNKDSC